ncbi:MFS transporter [Flindersiella endophytica]
MRVDGIVDRFLINPRFARIWLAGAISWVGDFVFDTTVLLWISTELAKGKPWAPAAASGVMIAILVPNVVVGPLAGVFVDRWDPRRTMLWSDLISAITVGALVVLPLLPNGVLPLRVQLILLYTAIVLITVVSRFFTPARFTIIADIVPETQQSRAAGITQATSATAAIIGPPLAAPLLFTAGVQWALVLNALSFVVSYLLIRDVRATRTASAAGGARAGFWQEFRTGLKTIVDSRVVRTVLIMGVIANIAMQAFSALGVFFVIDNLHTEAKFFGLQDTMLGLGVVIGAAIAGAFGERLGLVRVIWVSMVLLGVGFGFYARTASFVVALGMLLLTAVPLGVMNTAFSPLLIRTVPRDVLGRVFATTTPAVQAMGIAGVAVAGWLSSSVLRDLDADVLGVHFGTYDTIFVAGAVLIVLSGLYAAAALRRTE